MFIVYRCVYVYAYTDKYVTLHRNSHSKTKRKRIQIMLIFLKSLHTYFYFNVIISFCLSEYDLFPASDMLVISTMELLLADSQQIKQL